MRVIAILFFSILYLNTNAQVVDSVPSPIPALDKSQMDMSTFPADYALLKLQGKLTDPLVARVMYSRPQKNNRIIFGELVVYNEVWRFGANENTEIEFFKDLKINKTIIKKGKYSIFVLPTVDKWTFILNKELNTWGSFKYQSSKDVVRVTVPIETRRDAAESFFIYFKKTAKGFSMVSGWDNVQATLPITF